MGGAMRTEQTNSLMNTNKNQPIVHAIESNNSLSLYGEEDMALLTLHNNGLIKDCNNSCVKLLGCEFDKLRLQHISNFFPQLAQIALVDKKSTNTNLRFLSRVGHYFETVNMNGKHFSCRLFFNDIEEFGRHYLRVIVRPAIQEHAST